ncbi:MAG: methyltransferase domain-containing protein, partial [Candidatus Methylomirabilales bacterium]
THPSIYIRFTCRACRGPLQEVLNLGNLRLNAFPRHRWEVEQVQRVPVVLTVCSQCGLVQLDRSVPPDWMYRHYWYRSGVNESMVAELHAIVDEARSMVPLTSDSAVLDIGANDGTLLQRHASLPPPYPQVTRYAVEPALNLHDRLRAHCDVLIPDYFPLDTPPGPRFSVITAVAMCYDVEDPLKFFRQLHDLLAPGGVAVVQFQDFGQQLDAAAFDTCCHEHLEYYTLWSLTHLFKQTSLMVQRAQHTPINGGSLRLHLRRAEDGMRAEPSVHQQLLREAQQGLDTPGIREGNLEAFHTFRRRVERAKMHVGAAIETVLEQGCTLDILGASTKGNILLQVLDIGPGQARQAIDRSPEKTGCLTITGIPIVGEAQGRAEPADVWLCPIWQFKESVLRREAWFLEGGGTMIFPLPQTEIVQHQKEWLS